MSKIRWLLGIGLTLLLSLPALAATLQRVDAGILLQGKIVVGDLQRVRFMLERHGKLPFLLDSGGGRVLEALQIAEFIRAQGLTTHLPPNARCASACVLIFSGGVVRTADRKARIGVHMGSGLLNDEAIELIRKAYKQYGAEGTAIIGSWFEQAAALSVLKQVNFFLSSGVSLRLLQVAAQVDHLDIRWLTYAEAREFNLVNAD